MGSLRSTLAGNDAAENAAASVGRTPANHTRAMRCLETQAPSTANVSSWTVTLMLCSFTPGANCAVYVSSAAQILTGRDS